MAYKFILYFPDGETEESEDEYDTYDEAEQGACDWIGNYETGVETLHLSNPGDYPEEAEEVEFKIFEV